MMVYQCTAGLSFLVGKGYFVWEGTITLEDAPFTGTMTYYVAPLKMSGFNFKSGELFLIGHSYGLSCDEVT